MSKLSFKDVVSPHVDYRGQLSGVHLDKEKVFFTSDIHFFHRNIIDYCDRPFRTEGGAPDIDAMEAGLIENWNKKVPRDGIVFIVGDLAMGGKKRADDLARILRQLNGRKFLVPGNHDDYLFHSEACLKELEILTPLCELRIPDPDTKRGRQRVVLCHYAMKVWNRSHNGNWHLYGHSHHTMPPDYNIKAFDVGIDGKGYEYAPLSYSDVKNLMEMHGQNPVDHHNHNTN